MCESSEGEIKIQIGIEVSWISAAKFLAFEVSCKELPMSILRIWFPKKFENILKRECVQCPMTNSLNTS